VRLAKERRRPATTRDFFAGRCTRDRRGFARRWPPGRIEIADAKKADD
jgi:hypothetical protein